MVRIDSPERLGAVLRSTRVELNIPLLDLAEAAGTSHTLLRRQEEGRATRAIEVLFAVFREMGMEMYLQLPSSIDEACLDVTPGTRRRARP
jgi:transcriptional regulator with XRE-family HTH domain